MKNNNSTGIGIFGVLGVLFIILKLIGVIAWKWLWVLAPFWMPLAIAIAIFVICVIVGVIKGAQK